MIQGSGNPNYGFT